MGLEKFRHEKEVLENNYTNFDIIQSDIRLKLGRRTSLLQMERSERIAEAAKDWAKIHNQKFTSIIFDF